VAIVVRNDSVGPIQVPGRGNQNVILPGEVRVLTEVEYEKIDFANRGVGRLVAIAPNENTSETLRIKFDYYIPGGSVSEVRYIGYARQVALGSDPVWTVRRHSHGSFGSEWLITEIQVIENVAWDNRGGLAWT
jgi:hypothetical protein